MASASTLAQTQGYALFRITATLPGARPHFLLMGLAQRHLLLRRPRGAHAGTIGLAFLVGHQVGAVNQLALLCRLGRLSSALGAKRGGNYE
ncbi:hypothetical protein SCT_0779 [Sulfuricella sp. T08]|nr:hypothetical protein SCT_0779 [Sulfuricella sp. T08]